MKTLFGVGLAASELEHYVITLRGYGNLLLMLACAVSFGYSMFRIFQKEKPTFIKLIAVATACEFLRAFFITTHIWTTETAPVGYNTSTLGHIGIFLFLSMQSLSLPEVKTRGRKRLVPGGAALAAFVPSVIICIFPLKNSVAGQKTVFLLWAAVLSTCIFHTFKYLFAKDDENHRIASMRKTNLLILLYAYASMEESYCLAGFSYTRSVHLLNAGIVFGFIVQAVMIVLLPIFANKGAKQL